MAKPQPLKKERTNRRADTKERQFEPYHIEPETAHTAILLLLSKENEIICQTLRSLTKFCAAPDSGNRKIVFDFEAMKYTLPHIENHEINIKRFALKLLAQMCQLPRGPEQFLENPINTKKVAQLLATSQDLFVLEFASLVLAECSKEPIGCDQVLSANIFGALLKKLKDCIDPDVQKNCLQMVKNLIEDPVTSQEITKSNQFSWPPLLGLMQNPYPAIQENTLKVIQTLVGRYNDVNVQKSFKVSTGVSDLCHILESYQFRDIHTLALATLKTFVETEANAAHLYQSGGIQRLLDYLELALPQMKSHVLAVFAKMATTVNGRLALFETGTDLVFCHHLLSSTNDCISDAAFGVGHMCKMYESALRMADTDIVEAIASIISDESMMWFDTRMNALQALSILCRIIHKAACATVESKNWNSLRSICRKAKDNPPPVEAQRLTIQCYINLLNYQISTKAMLNGEFISEILGCLQRIDIQLKILSAKLLTGFVTDDTAKNIFSNKKGEEIIDQNLRIEHVGLRTALCELIIATVTEDSADVYLGLDTIYYMIKNKTARYKVCAWEPALEAILRHHPSAKLAYIGRLDINDMTSDGFYVMKRLDDAFETMTNLLEAQSPFSDPVLVASFLPGQDISTDDIRTSWSSSSPIKVNVKSKATSSPLPDDANLRAYLLQLKIWLGDPYREKCEEVSSSLKARAQVLGEYVAEQMSGLTQERDCSLPSVEIHLVDLMLEFKRRVVGLGYVKCGGALERAVLYKVLADRLGLPCSLHRTTNAHAWVEVAVPEIDPEEDIKDERYPAGLLRENYIVDLTVNPGKLIPLSSHEARRICGPSCSSRYVAGSPPRVCKCIPLDICTSSSRIK